MLNMKLLSAEPSWWNHECRGAEVKRKAALHSFKCNSNSYDDLLLNYKRSAKETFSRIKKESFKNVCSSPPPLTKPSIFWSTIKRFRRRNLHLFSFSASTTNIQKLVDIIRSLSPFMLLFQLPQGISSEP